MAAARSVYYCVMRWLLQVMGHIQSLEIEEENELASLEVMLVRNSDIWTTQQASQRLVYSEELLAQLKVKTHECVESSIFSTDSSFF